MDYAVIENGVVTNIIVASKDYVHAFEGEAIPSNEAQIGWTYKNGVFFPPLIEKEKDSLSPEIPKTESPVKSIKAAQENEKQV